jgi:hypothetical protein
LVRGAPEVRYPSALLSIHDIRKLLIFSFSPCLLTTVQVKFCCY